MLLHISTSDRLNCAEEPSDVGAKRCDVSWFRSKFKLVVALIRVKVIEYRGSVQDALFACFMSTHIQILVGCLGLGASTIGETHGVGPSRRSITPCCSSPSSWSSSCFRIRKGTRRWDCADGWSLLSMGRPVNTSSYSYTRCSGCQRTCNRYEP